MNDYYFTFRSITTAQTGSVALHDAGLGPGSRGGAAGLGREGGGVSGGVNPGHGAAGLRL